MKEFGASGFNLHVANQKAEETRMKGRITSNASNMAVKILNDITGSQSCRIVKSNTDGLIGDRVFSGVLKVTASVVDHGDRKEIEVPFQVENSIVKNPNRYIVKRKLSFINPTTSRHLNSDERMSSQIDALKKQEESIPAKEGEGKDITAKTIEIPSGTGGGGANTTDRDLVKRMEFEKVNLPADTAVDDRIVVNGRTWKVEGDAPNSFGQEHSSRWILSLVEDGGPDKKKDKKSEVDTTDKTDKTGSADATAQTEQKQGEQVDTATIKTSDATVKQENK